MMKKCIVVFVFLFALTCFSHALNPLNLKTDLVETTSLGRNGDTVPDFQVGHVRFVTDNTGSATYKNGWIRNTTQWCLYRSYNDGPLTVKADEGYWIKDITFTYVNQARGILVDYPGASQSKIPAYASGKAIVVNGTQKQFYVGKDTTGDGGYLTFTKFMVRYCQMPTALTLENQTMALGDAFQLSPVVQPVGADTIYTWSSDNIAVVSVDTNGVLMAHAVGEAQITVSAGQLSASCTITVVADSSLRVVETLSQCAVEKNYNGTTSIVGDKGLYQWQATYFQRQLTGADDQVGDKQGIRLRYKGSLTTEGKPEGGIKAIAFDWRTANGVNIVNYSLQAGEQQYTYNSDAVKSGQVNHFSRLLEVKENTSFSLQMASKIGTEGQAYVIFGPITITPYLLFARPNHRDTIQLNGASIYDLNKVLINNTGDEPVFSVTSNSTGAVTSISNGLLSIGKTNQGGEITIQASWNASKVTTTLTLLVDVLYDPSSDSAWTETFSHCYATEVFDNRIHVMGDQGIYDWSVARFQRDKNEDVVGNQQGIRLRYNGAIATNDIQEGGVKALAFDWRVTNADMPVRFIVQVGERSYEYESAAIPTTQLMHYIRPCWVSKNTKIKIAVPSQEDPAQSYLVVGPLSIIPYLLFTTPERIDTIRLSDTTSYDLHEAMIDNTDGEGEIVYTIEQDETCAAQLLGSVVDLSQVQRNGWIALKATWGDVTTTMQLWVDAQSSTDLHRPEMDSPANSSTKVLINHHLYILRDGHKYDLQGNKIKF